MSIDLRRESIKKLRLLIEELEDESERLPDNSDESLVRFLRSRKYDLDKAFESSKKLAKLYHSHKDEISNITEEEIALYDRNLICLIRESGPRGRVIVIVQSKEQAPFITETVKKTPKAVVRFHLWLFRKLSFDVQAQVNGLIVIANFADITWANQIALSRIASIGDYITIFQYFSSLGFRLKQGLFLHEPAYFSWVWYIASPFMSSKIKSRVTLCGANRNKIKEIIEDISILPKNLGGNLDNYDPSLRIAHDTLEKLC